MTLTPCSKGGPVRHGSSRSKRKNLSGLHRDRLISLNSSALGWTRILTACILTMLNDLYWTSPYPILSLSLIKMSWFANMFATFSLALQVSNVGFSLCEVGGQRDSTTSDSHRVWFKYDGKSFTMSHSLTRSGRIRPSPLRFSLSHTLSHRHRYNHLLHIHYTPSIKLEQIHY